MKDSYLSYFRNIDHAGMGIPNIISFHMAKVKFLIINSNFCQEIIILQEYFGNLFPYMQIYENVIHNFFVLIN